MRTIEQTQRNADVTQDDPRWMQVVERNPEADGRFCYSVRTTGVYCRPSCAARLALPQNVRFHDTPQDAERAGFRPCKRCKPRAMAADALRFALGECALGAVLVAHSEHGLRAIALGDDRKALLDELTMRFPDARRMEDPVALGDVLRQVIDFVETPRHDLHLPLDIRGSDFQRRVWQALRAVPAGGTATYAQIARSIDEPRAARAVAAACAANPLAVVIPCHRVVRSNGALSGYRWGVERKRALLDREARA